MEGVGIDIRQIETDNLPEQPFPAGRAFRIHMTQEAHDNVWWHARRTVVSYGDIKEVGGMLVGNVYRDAGGPYLAIKAAIAGEHTRNEGTQVTFTPETWAQVNQVREQLYPQDRIVGWYHTHPRFGIFLSEPDQFIHAHSFSQPWATAYVVDPVQNLEGFFVWNDGAPRVAQEFWVGDEVKTAHPSNDPLKIVVPPESNGDVQSTWRARFVFGVVLTVLIAIVTGGIYLWQAARREDDRLLSRALRSEAVELDRVLQTTAKLHRDLSNSPDGSAQQNLFEIETGLRRVALIVGMMSTKFENGAAAGAEPSTAGGDNKP